MKLIFLTVALFTTGFIHAQDYIGLDSFIGQWQGTGQLFGQEANYNMTWEESLDGQFVKLSFSNEMISNGRGIKAEAYYKSAGEHDVIGKWFDNRGYFIEIEGTLSETSLINHWVNEHEQGKTIYTIISTDSIVVKDFVWKDEEYVSFGDAEYSKSKE